MNKRVFNFNKSRTEKGMNKPETVDYYSKLLSKNKIYYKRIAKRALSLKPDAQIIADIGTGPGFIAIQLAKKSEKEVLALDISPNMLEKTKEYAKKAKVKIKTVESSCEKMPFEDKSIDLLTAGSLLHYLEDPFPCLKEIKRVMRSGGKVLIAGLKRDTWFVYKELLFVGSKIILWKKPLENLSTVIDASYTEQEIIDLMKKAGINSFRVYSGLIRQEVIIGF